MSPLAAIHSAIIQVLNYKGRASRSEFWWNFVLFIVLLPGVTAVWGQLALRMASVSGLVFIIESLLIFVYVASLMILLPLTIRRLHDVGSPWWRMLVMLIPYGIGFIILFYFLAKPSMEGDNYYGPNPRPKPRRRALVTPTPSGQPFYQFGPRADAPRKNTPRD